MRKWPQTFDTSGEDSFAYARYLQEVFADYIRNTECKRLINQLAACQARERFKSVCVLSDLTGEGKSFLVLVLAMGYATLLNSRVLIVDAVEQTAGRALFLDRILWQRSSQIVESVIHEGGNGVIDLVTTKSQEKEHIESTDFHIGPYVESLRERYDLVLFDTCALAAAAKTNMDPVIIASYADTSLLVTSSRSLSSGSLARLKSSLQRWNIRLLGTVHNSGLNR